MNLTQKRKLVDYHIASRRTRLTTEEGYDFAFIPEGREPKTAAWRYDKTLHRHNIIVNSGLERLITRDKKYRNQLIYAQRTYDHEGGHSLFTYRDIDDMVRRLKDAKIPFFILNLFEDARIEGKWRQRFKRRFNWLRFEHLIDEEPKIPTLPKGEDKPQSAIRLFLDCIRMENSYSKLRSWVAKDKDPKVAYRGEGEAKYGRRQLIMWFYRRALHCSATLNLMPIMKAWCLTFPETAAPDCSDIVLIMIDMPTEGDSGGMPEGAEDADGSKHEEIKATITISGALAGKESTAPKAKKEEDEKRRFDGTSKRLEVPTTVFFRSRPIRKMNYLRGDRLIRLFEKFLEGGEGMESTRIPGGKINMRRWLRGAEDFYIRRGPDPYGVKEISFIMDCSGSMARALEDGVYLAYILNELVRRRKIECKKMILCGGSNQAIPMPFDPRILAYLHAPGAIEGFVGAMRQYEKDLLASDMTIFFTDGIITDEHINKAHWHRRGIYTIGLFVGEPERSEVLHQWFDSVLVRHNIESVADSLIQIIKRGT